MNDVTTNSLSFLQVTEKDFMSRSPQMCLSGSSHDSSVKASKEQMRTKEGIWELRFAAFFPRGQNN